MSNVNGKSMHNVCFVIVVYSKGIFKPFVKAINKLFNAELFLFINPLL